MAKATSIEWTEMTWNPVTGCTKVSPGCANCYAERMAKRLQAMRAPRYRRGFTLSMHDDALTASFLTSIFVSKCQKKLFIAVQFLP